MSKFVNWTKIAGFATALFLAGALVGFIVGSPAPGAGLQSADQRLVQSTLLSLFFASVIFTVMAARQEYRPFLHASLALLGTFAFSLVLGSVLQIDTPPILVAFGWLTEAVGLVIGTSIGRHLLRRFRTSVT